MRTLLLKDIYRKIKQIDWEQLPLGLKGGKISLVIFLSLYSEETNNSQSRKLASKMLQNIIRDKEVTNYTLLSGNLGIAWALYVLCEKNILTSDDSVTYRLNLIMKEFSFRYNSAPLVIVDDERLFSAGIYMLMQQKNDNSLEHYRTQERLINLVDECERQLTWSLKEFYSINELPLSMIHSYFYFLQTCVKKKIFIYKAKSLLSLIEKIYLQTKEQSLCDRFICDFFFKRGEFDIPAGLDNGTLFEFVGDLGFYSLLYNEPTLFQTALKQINKKYIGFKTVVKSMFSNKSHDSLSLATICGWGYGLLLNKDSYE